MERDRDQECVFQFKQDIKEIQSTCGQVNHFKATTLKKLQKNSKKVCSSLTNQNNSKQCFNNSEINNGEIYTAAA